MTARGPDLCRSCKAPILWSRTMNGKSIPLDYEPNADGNVVLEPQGARNGLLETRAVVLGNGTLELAAAQAGGHTLYMPHHATCPHGMDWRRR
jgi:hypothetical protein